MTTTSAHTSGPWEHYDRGGMGWDVDGPPQGIKGMFLREADARLAAAAPDMLAALERVIANGCVPVHWTTYGVVQTAIAKAKGEA